MKKKVICPRCTGNGYIKVKEKVDWPSKERDIVVQCSMCDSEGEIEYGNGGSGSSRSDKTH